MRFARYTWKPLSTVSAFCCQIHCLVADSSLVAAATQSPAIQSAPEKSVPQSLPEEYGNFAKLALSIPHYGRRTPGKHSPIFKGTVNSVFWVKSHNIHHHSTGRPAAKVFRTWPHLNNLVKERKHNAFERLPLEAQQAIRQRNVAWKHVGQDSANITTVLSQFQRFMCEHGEKKLLEQGSYEVLVLYPRLNAFFKFLQLWGCSAATVRNKAGK
jgi:hypothetical protein